MPTDALHITLPLANRIFQRANQLATPGALIGVLHIRDNALQFEENADSEHFTDNQIPVYLHTPDSNTADKYLLVETGTKGVMELSACRRENDHFVSLPVIT